MTLQIVDTHQHLWNLKHLDLPWVASIPDLNRNFELEDYQLYTCENKESEFSYVISQTIYMEVDVAVQDQQKEIDLVLTCCRDPATPMTGLVAPCRPDSPKFEQSVEFARSNPEIKGFRRVLHTDATPRGTCLSGEFLAAMKLLGAKNLPFEICIRREELPDVVKLAASCPETKFILDHGGNVDARMNLEEWHEWKNNIFQIARLKNVCCKVSGFVWTIQKSDWNYERDIEPILGVILDAFGENRLMFGGDWPVCTLSKLSFQQWLNAIYQFSQVHQFTHRLFFENAQRIYRL